MAPAVALGPQLDYAMPQLGVDPVTNISLLYLIHGSPL
jgi:hypothetical protein